MNPDGMDALDQLVGTWRLTSSLPSDGEPPHAETRFEWLAGGRFLIQRWEVDHPAAPDGIAASAPATRRAHIGSTTSTRAASSASTR